MIAHTTLDGKVIKYRKGALRKQLGLTKKQKLNRPELVRASKVKIGQSIRIAGKTRKMTRLMKKRVVLGANLMKRNKPKKRIMKKRRQY